jgi:hypothetical protein
MLADRDDREKGIQIGVMSSMPARSCCNVACYRHAARLMDELEDLGVVGPPQWWASAALMSPMMPAL